MLSPTSAPLDHWSCLFVFHNNSEATQIGNKDLSEVEGTGIFQAPLKTLLESENAEAWAQGLQIVRGWIDSELHIPSLDEAKLEEHFNTFEQKLTNECSSDKVPLNDEQEGAIAQTLIWYKLIFTGFKELLEKAEVYKSLLKESFGILSGDLTQECTQIPPLEGLSEFNQILQKINDCKVNINECYEWCKKAIDAAPDQPEKVSLKDELEDIKGKFNETEDSIKNALFELVRLAEVFKAFVEEQGEFSANDLSQKKIKGDRSAQYKQLKQIPAPVAQLRKDFQLLLSKAPAENTSGIANEAVNYA